MRMLDLFCGRGGWTKGFQAHGFDCIGVDIDPRFKKLYPGEFNQIDVLSIHPDQLRGMEISIICASPPCEEFSRHTMPWTRAKNPQEPWLSLRLIERTKQIAQSLGVLLILENVRTAQRWLGPSVMHCGPFHLWGDGVPALIPHDVQRRTKESYGSKERDKRAEIPFPLADWIARCYAHPPG